VRIIARKHLINFWRTHPDAEQPLKAWYDEVIHASWKKPQDIKSHYRNASFISGNRVVFNIKGNSYRLVVAVAYSFGAVYIKFIGNHTTYDRINAGTVQLEEK